MTINKIPRLDVHIHSRNAFGGEILSFNLMVNRVEEAKTKKEGAEEK